MVLLSVSLHCTQFAKVLEIYWEIHIRHPHLAESAVSAATGNLHRLSGKGAVALCFVKNMLIVLEGMDTNSARQHHMR